jgi:hypothetical protein
MVVMSGKKVAKSTRVAKRKELRGPAPVTLASFDGTFEQAIDTALAKQPPGKGLAEAGPPQG